MRTTIPAVEVEILRKALRELPPLVWTTTIAIKADHANGTLSGTELERFRQFEGKLVAAISRIREIAET